ncbi:MAG: tripartite tricarboxylate transporter TctB family protein [Pyramidobacter sp.]|nr:tripartite tricarboxylate transporter TctB family protein [Pyramidobacter sp.]
MFELILNVLLWLGLLYTLNFNVLEAPVPQKVIRNPYALSPDVWPKVIIVLLLICIAFNIINIIRKNKGNPDFSLGHFFGSIPGFLKSRIFIGIAIVVIASFILESLGFMATCFLLLASYGYLLGERKIVRLVVVTALVTVFLYLAFSVLLSVNLPRGTLPAMRNFALLLESFIS